MNKFKLLFLSCLFLSRVFYSFPAIDVNTALSELNGKGCTELSSLLSDVQKYKIADQQLIAAKGFSFIHMFEPLEHQIIVAQHCLNGGKSVSADQDKNLLEGLSERALYVLYIAALIHDIGKAGDSTYVDVRDGSNTCKCDGAVVECVSKWDHERLGFEYILNACPNLKCDKYNSKYKGKIYLKVDGGTINFELLFKQLGFTIEEQKIVTVLVGSHKLFPALYAVDEKEQTATDDKVRGNAFAAFFEGLNKLIEETGLNLTKDSYRDLAIMSCVMALVDMFAVYFEADLSVKSPLFSDYIECPKRRAFVETLGVEKGFIAWWGHKGRTEEQARKYYTNIALNGFVGIPNNDFGALAIIDQLNKSDY